MVSLGLTAGQLDVASEVLLVPQKTPDLDAQGWTDQEVAGWPGLPGGFGFGQRGRIGSDLVLPQQLSGGEEPVAQHGSSGFIQGSEPGDAFLVVHGEQRFGGNVRVVEQVRAVAGDQNLRLP